MFSHPNLAHFVASEVILERGLTCYPVHVDTMTREFVWCINEGQREQGVGWVRRGNVMSGHELT